jgi:hypothetical protein
MKTDIKIIVALIFVAVFGVWLFLRGGDMPTNFETPTYNETTSVYIPEGEQAVTLYHQGSGGNHTYRGTIMLPTPCHSLETGTEIEKKLPENVTINITTTSSAEMCAQVISSKTFTVSFSADDEHAVLLRVNGTLVPTTVVEGMPPVESINTAPPELQ